MARTRMAAVFFITVILFCCSIYTCKGAACDHFAPVGGDYRLPLLTNQGMSRLKWKHKDDVVFSRKHEEVHTRTAGYEVSDDGSLLLKGVTKEKKGRYEAEVHDDAGRKLANTVYELCVQEPVNSPNIKMDCKTDFVVFTCQGDQPEGVAYQWLKNDKLVPKEGDKSMTRKAKDVETDKFICRVSNNVSNASSKAAEQKCYNPGFFEQEFMGIDVWILVAAGAGVVVLLLIIVVICCVRTKRRKRMHVKDEEELRLGWSNPNQHHHHHHHHPANQRQHHQNHNHQQQQQQQQQRHPHPQRLQQPAGNTGPRPHRTKQQRHKNPEQPGTQPEPSPRRPVQASKPADEEQPPPLPQPRKKAPKPTRA